MSDIFLCYRRNDNPQTAWHLQYILKNKGYKTFLDTNIPWGRDWEEDIKHEIATCAIFICFIGPNWLGKDREGVSGIYDSNDNVRKEIELAILKDKTILPILVGDDATFPKPGDLPESLRKIASIEHVKLRFIPPGFDDDAEKIAIVVWEKIRKQRGIIWFATNAIYRLTRRRLVVSACSAIASSMATLLFVIYFNGCGKISCDTVSDKSEEIHAETDEIPIPDVYDEIMARGTDGGPKRVVIGYRKYSMPVSYTLDKGIIEGFMLEACEYVVKNAFKGFDREKREVVSDEEQENGRIKLIKKKKIDIECGSTSITESRKELVDFLETHVYSQTRFISPRSIQFHDLDAHELKARIDADNKKIVNYVIGTTNRDVLSISGTVLGDFQEFIKNIRNDEVHVAFTDDLLLAGILSNLNKKNYLISRVGFGPLEQYGIMLPKNSPKLAKALQSAWDDLSEQGKICDLYRKYFASQAIAPHIKRIYEDVDREENHNDLKFKCLGRN